MKPGTKVKLQGISKHGKECEQRQGYTWIVVRVRNGLKLGRKEERDKLFALLRAEGRPDVDWRWVALEEDRPFVMAEENKNNT